MHELCFSYLFGDAATLTYFRIRDRDTWVSGECVRVWCKDTNVLVQKIEELDWLVATNCALSLIDISITLVNGILSNDRERWLQAVTESCEPRRNLQTAAAHPKSQPWPAFRSVTKGSERTTGSGNQKTIAWSTGLYSRVLRAFGFYFSETFQNYQISGGRRWKKTRACNSISGRVCG